MGSTPLGYCWFIYRNWRTDGPTNWSILRPTPKRRAMAIASYLDRNALSPWIASKKHLIGQSRLLRINCPIEMGIIYYSGEYY